MEQKELQRNVKKKKKKKIDENRKNVSGRMCLMIILKLKRIFTISLGNAVLEPSQPC